MVYHANPVLFDQVGRIEDHARVGFDQLGRIEDRARVGFDQLGMIEDQVRVGFDQLGMIEDQVRVMFVERRVMSISRWPELDICDAPEPDRSWGLLL